MPADTRLRDIAQSLLDVVATELAVAGIDVPERQYIHSGDVAQDFGEGCDEALIVTFTSLFQGTVATQAQGPQLIGPNTAIQCAVPLLAQFVIFLLRCVPTLDEDGNAPSSDDLQASAESLLEDSMTLPVIIIDSQLDQQLTGLNCSLVGIGAVQAVGPFGAIGGTSVQLVVGLV